MTRIEIAKKAAEASNIKYNFICPFCEAKMICRKSEFSRHKNFCKKNPNKKEVNKEKILKHLKKLNTSRRKKNGWKCKHCEEKFETRKLLFEHLREKHPEFSLSKEKNSKEWKCLYCNESFETRKLLFAHNKICLERKKLPKDSAGRIIPDKFEEKTCEFCGKIMTTTYGYTYHINRCDKNPNKSKEFPWKGKKHKPETRIKVASAYVKYLNKDINIIPKFDINACKYIDELNKKNNWNLQHALNGGEIKVGPFSLDGYDKELNIVFEYDEPFHENPNNKLKDKDREQYIIEQINPKEFWRYSEKFDKLYRIL